MRVRNLLKGLAKRLGMVAVVSGMGLSISSDGYAVTVPIIDSGFEHHIIDDSSGYAYGAAGQAGDADGFNNPSSANGGVSPWQALASNGNGIAGDNASWIFNSSYSAVNSGDQASEVQGVMAQNLTATYIAGLDYIATVAASAAGGDDRVVVGLYDAGAVTLTTAAAFLAEPSLVAGTEVITSDTYSDETFTFKASSLVSLIGKNIGIAIYATDATGQGPWIDDVRLDAVVPEPGSLALLGLGGVTLVGLRRRR